MKKTIVTAMMIIALAATGFAQELKFDGYVNSGLGLIATDAKDSHPVIKAFGVDSEQNGYRFRLNGSYTNEAKTIGAKLRLQAQSKAGAISLPYFYGWVKFLNFFTLTGGLVDDSTWTTGDWWIADDSGEGLGLLLKAAPIEGLDLGFGAYAASQLGGGDNNALVNTSGLPFPVTNAWDAKYVMAGAYTMKDMFRVGLTFRTKNKAGHNNAVDWAGRQESQQLIGEFRFLGVKDLTAVMAANIDKLENFKQYGETTISETFGYKIDSLAFGLNAVQFFYNTDKKDANGKNITLDPSLLFNLWGQYAIDKVVPRLDMVYFVGGKSNIANKINSPADMAYHRKGYTQVKDANKNNDKDDFSVFTIRPSVKFNLDSRTFIEIGDAINFDMTTYDEKSGKAYSKDKNSLVSNVFYVDLKFAF
jgi:hypothetical protein